MTRGRPPLQALKDATPIAGKRGEVWHYQPKSGSTCDFTIMSPGRIAFICVKQVRRLRCTTAELSRKFLDTITAIRLIAYSPVISRELWIRSPKGVWRFFRINDESFNELGNDGVSLTSDTSNTTVVRGKISGTLSLSPILGEGHGEGREFASQKTSVSDMKGL
jgi:hypothetical protein